jgi:hypothetical protein
MRSILEPQLGWWHIAIMAAGLLVAYEVCCRIAWRRREETREAKKSQADVAVAALLALLGLLLAFSFQIGAERFDKRKALVLDESNAITTTYLRATLVQAPYSQRIQELLREYVQVRAKVTSADELERALKESGRLHGELWASATAIAREEFSRKRAAEALGVARQTFYHWFNNTMKLTRPLVAGRAPPALVDPRSGE